MKGIKGMRESKWKKGEKEEGGEKRGIEGRDEKGRKEGMEREREGRAKRKHIGRRDGEGKEGKVGVGGRRRKRLRRKYTDIKKKG